MNVVYDLRGGLEVQPPEAKGFFNFKASKLLKFRTKRLKNAKINNANLCYNFSPKPFYNRVGLCPPSPHKVAYG